MYHNPYDKPAYNPMYPPTVSIHVEDEDEEEEEIYDPYKGGREKDIQCES